VSAPWVIQPERVGKALVLLGLGLFGAFVLVSRWLFRTGRYDGALRYAFGSEVTVVLVLLVSTVLVVVGTAALLRRQPTGSVRLADVLFIVVGLVASGAGAWFCSRMALEAILAR
jgi:hypothetical protein